MFENLFYKRLTELRMAKGVSAREMSLDMGQGAGYINRIENKRGFPTMENFFYICEYFHVTPKEFFDDNMAYSADLLEFIDVLKRLSPEQRSSLLSVAKNMI